MLTSRQVTVHLQTIFIFLSFLPSISCFDPNRTYPNGQGEVYPPVQGSNALGTYLFGFDGCTDTRKEFVKQAYVESVKLSDAPGVKSGIKFNGIDSAAASELFGRYILTPKVRTQVQNILTQVGEIAPGRWYTPSNYIHVRCGEPNDQPNKKCTRKDYCSNPPVIIDTGVQAYSDQSDDRAMRYGLSQTEPNERANLQNYENRARCFFHECTHLDWFMDAGPDKPNDFVSDWRVAIKDGKTERRAETYGAFWTKVLAYYKSRTNPVGSFSSKGADNYAMYALARYVKANALGDHPWAPVVTSKLKPIRAPVEIGAVGNSAIQMDVTSGGVIFDADQTAFWAEQVDTCADDPDATQPTPNDAILIDEIASDSDLPIENLVENRGWLANAFTFGDKLSGLNLRVLPLGDSITNGFQSSDGNGYRQTLHNALSSNQVDFIGSQSSGSMSDNQHEGHNGATIDQISDYASGVLSQRPNVVLLHAGTNDMNGNVDPDNAPTRLGNLIDKIYKTCPDAVIFVAKIIPSGNPTTQARIVSFNTALPGIIGSRASAGKKIFLVDMYSRLIPSVDYADDLHPNDQGYQRMGNAWYAAMAWTTSMLDWIDQPVRGSGSGGNGGLITCNPNPVWIPQGEIANGAGLGKDLQSDIHCGPTPGKDGYCTCGTGIDSPTGDEYTVPLTGVDCQSMGYNGVHSLHFADIDGDGRAEYLHVGAKGEVHAFYNQGPLDGQQEGQKGATVGWWDAGIIATGVGARREEVRFADLNGDGRAEYIWVHPNGSASVWLNQGKLADGKTPANVGWFAQGLVAGGIGAPGASIRFADLNGDGRAEYLSINNQGGVTVYLNLGPKTGTDPKGAQVAWLPQKQTATGVGGNRDQTFFADINGDGRADYIYFPDIHNTGEIDLWRNGGSPDNGPHAGERVWINMKNITNGDGTPGYKVMLADLNGDGRAEYLEVDPFTSAVKAYLNGCPGL